MPTSNMGYPYDPELFLYQWSNAPDPVKLALLSSGVMSNNGTLRSLISQGSDNYTLPFYNTIGGVPDNYDGVDTITTETPDGSSQSGVVYGRAKSWKDKDFIHDFNSGADPMRQITSQVAKYWSKRRQEILLKILNGIFTAPTDSSDRWAEWQKHTTNLATKTAAVADVNMVGATTAGDSAQKACGDNASIFTMEVMHSTVANHLAGLQLLQFRKYTDPMGIEQTLNIADHNGMTVIVDDGVPVADSASASAAGAKEYTTFLLGAGAIQYAPAPVKVPVEIGREQLKEGGFNYYVTRMREAMHPNGFTFSLPKTGYTKSPTNDQLGAGANWTVAGVPKAIPIARIITNG